MSVKDPFQQLVDELTLIRHDMERLKRTSLDKDEAEALAALASSHPQLQVELLCAAELPAALAELRLVSRQTIALLCGHPDSVETFARRLYLAGLPRSQVFADVFLPHAR